MATKPKKPVYRPSGATHKSTDVSKLLVESGLNNGTNKIDPALLDPLREKRIEEISVGADSGSYVTASVDEIPRPKLALKPSWQGLNNRKPIKAFNLRPTAEIKERLAYITKMTGISQHEVCITAMIPSIIEQSNELFAQEQRGEITAQGYPAGHRE